MTRRTKDKDKKDVKAAKKEPRVPKNLEQLLPASIKKAKRLREEAGIPTSLPHNVGMGGEKELEAARARYGDFDDPRKLLFLMAFAEEANIRKARVAAGIKDKRLSHHWRLLDEKFRRGYEIAMCDAADALERSMYQRGLKGLKKYKFRKNGQPIKHPVTGKPYFERQFDTNAAMFLLRGLRPDRYGGKSEFGEFADQVVKAFKNVDEDKI